MDSHIDKLFGKLIQLRYQLLVDSKRKIGNEYQQMIVPMITNMDDTRPQLPLPQVLNECSTFRYQVES